MPSVSEEATLILNRKMIYLATDRHSCHQDMELGLGSLKKITKMINSMLSNLELGSSLHCDAIVISRRKYNT